MLTAAEAVEAELSKKGAPGSSALAVAPADDTASQTSELEDLATQVENLTANTRAFLRLDTYIILACMCMCDCMQGFLGI